MLLTEEGCQELIKRVGEKCLYSSKVAYLCALYEKRNTKGITPKTVSDFVLSCSLRQEDDFQIQLIGPNDTGIVFVTLFSKIITEFIHEELGDNVKNVGFSYRKN